MRTAVVGNRVARLKDRAVYTIARMTPIRAIAPMVELARTALDRLCKAEEAVEAAHEGCLTADAILHQADLECDDRVRDFAQEVRLAARNDTRSPLYRGYFPAGSTRVTKAPPAKAVERVRLILSRLPRETNPRLSRHAEPLAAACAAVEEALQAQKAAEGAERTAIDSLKAEKLDWIHNEIELYHRLQIHFRENPKLAEEFFRKDLRPRPDVDVEAEAEGIKGAGGGGQGSGEDSGRTGTDEPGAARADRPADGDQTPPQA